MQNRFLLRFGPTVLILSRSIMVSGELWLIAGWYSNHETIGLLIFAFSKLYPPHKLNESKG